MEGKGANDLMAVQGNRVDRRNPERASAMAGNISENRGGRGEKIPEETVLEGNAWSDRRRKNAHLITS